MERKTMVGLIAIVAIVVAVMFAGCIEITHALSVPLTVNETAGFARFDELITSGVPIPRDLQLTDISTLCLLDANDTPIPVQFTPLARWGGAPDNSLAPVKWLLLDFQTDIPAEGMVCYYLRNTADMPPAYPALSITDGVDDITVGTGTAIFSLNKIDGCLSAPGLGSPIYGRLHEPGGGTYTTTGPVTVSIALNGTMRASLKVQGAYCNETGKVLLNYTNHYWFYAGQSTVRLFHTVENNNLCPLVEYGQPDCYDIGSGGSVNISDLSLIVQTNISAPINYYVGGEGEIINGTLSDELVLYQDSSGTDHWDCYPDLTDWYGNPLDTRPRMQSYVSFRGYRISLGGTNISSGDYAPGWMCISDSDADSAWCVAVRDFWQNFPKALRATPTPTGTLEIGLFPDEFGPAGYSFNLRAGEHKTHEILLYPHDITSGVPTYVRVFNDPLFAHAPAEWYVNSGAFGLTAVRNFADWPDHEHYVDYQLTTSPDYEEWMDWYPNLLVAIENTDFYGIFDYGDWPIDYEGYGVAPLNPKYDTDNGMWLQWARGGDHRWFRLAEAADRHLADMDILHNLHSPRHWGDGIAFGHSYHDEDGFINPHRNYGGNHPDTAFGMTGMLMTYYLTGYEKAYESALELADCIEYRLHNDEHLCDFFPPGECSGEGYALGEGMYDAGCRPVANCLSIAVAAYRATADPCYLAVADAVVDWARASDQPYINGTTGEDQMMRPWMLNMYLHALSNYLEMRGEFCLPDTYDAEGSFLAYADWLHTYAWLDLTPIDTGSRAAYPYEWWFDGRSDNNDPSICNWLLLGADAMAYAYRISGEDDYLGWATRLFRTGSRDPFFEGDANTYSATKETVNGISFGHLFLHEWAQQAASTYYVAPTGDNFNPGTIDQPWRTIQHAVENVVPGDTIYVRDGTYNEWISISNSGLPGQPITLRSYPNETVILNGSGLEWRYGIDIGGADYWTFQDLIIRDYIREGLRGFGFVSWSGSKGITIRNLDFSLVGTPIKFHEGGENILIEDIYAHDYDNGGFDCGPAGPCSNLTIRRFSALGPGTGDDTGVDGFAVEEGSNVLVEDCIAEGHPGDGFDFKSDNTTLRRVISRCNARNNIKLWGQDSRLENGLSHDCGLTNLVLAEGGSYTVINSLIANRDTYGYLAVVGYDQPLDTPLRLHNTIFYNDNPLMGGTTLYLGDGVHLTADHNIYYNPYREEDVICAGFLGGQCFSKDDINDGTWFNASGCGEHSIYAEPLFVNPATQDYHLTVESPAIDAGTVEDAPLDDLDGNKRPQGDGYDIGPYEYVEGELTVTWIDNDFNESTPGWHYDHFDNIQDGIDAVAENGTVFVYNGTYYENVVVNKTIDLIGENRNTTTIDGSGTGDVVYVAADLVNISGFSIRNGSEDGICILCCSNHTINGNNVYNNRAGISLYSSNRSSISNNILHHNTKEGIVLWYVSNNNTIDENNISYNQWGIEVGYSSNNQIFDNEVFNNYFGIEIDNSTNITAENNTVSGNQDYGIELVNSSDNDIIANHIISNPNNGIDIWYNATENRIHGNWIAGNNGWGIELGFSSNNLIFNNYFNNTNNAWDDGNNVWNITKTAGTNIICGPYLGGNYWGDYTGGDTDGDGLGDTLIPYNSYGDITNGGDWHPLVESATSLPDLVIHEKWVCWPDNCTIYYNVTNIGNGTAPLCHNTALYVDGVAVAHDHVPVPLAPGESYTGCFNGYVWTYTPPSDNITVCADNTKTVVELDETNNCLTNIWMCGDVNNDGKVTMSDVRKVFNRYLDPNYPLDLPWAADVNCDGKVTMSDVRKVFNRYLDPGYELNCCCEGVG